jgi:hypothetical protein
MTPNFTAIGHFCSLRIGLCFYPMARERGRPPLRLLNPATLEYRVPSSGIPRGGYLMGVSNESLLLTRR